MSSLNRVYQVSNPLYRCFSRHLCSLGVGRVSSLENNTRWSSLTEHLRVCEFVGGCIGNLRDFGFRRRGFKPHVRWNTSTTWTNITEDMDSELGTARCCYDHSNAVGLKLKPKVSTYEEQYKNSICYTDRQARSLDEL
jgi:hypothetical protein